MLIHGQREKSCLVELFRSCGLGVLGYLHTILCPKSMWAGALVNLSCTHAGTRLLTKFSRYLQTCVQYGHSGGQGCRGPDPHIFPPKVAGISNEKSPAFFVRWEERQRRKGERCLRDTSL